MMRIRLQYHLIPQPVVEPGRFGGGGLSRGSCVESAGISSVGKGDATAPFRYGNRRGGQCGEGQPTKKQKGSDRKM
jgi:hypothetical protein